MMKEKQLQHLLEAKRQVGEAEACLAAAIATLEAGSRAEKVTVSSAVRDALRQLSDAQASLCKVEAADSVIPPA